MIINKVILTKRADENLRKIPQYIADKFQRWFAAVEYIGVCEVRKIKSYHDEPLQGNRFGQRSIRLSKSYRAFYIEKQNGAIEFIEIQEINKHVY